MIDVTILHLSMDLTSTGHDSTVVPITLDSVYIGCSNNHINRRIMKNFPNMFHRLRGLYMIYSTSLLCKVGGNP
jgi:hypothetical protein